MVMFRVLVLTAIGFSLVGCATRSLELSENDKGAFYDLPKDKKLATIYLTCGKNANNGNYDSPLMISENAACVYKINGKPYSQIFKGEVGRVDIPAGNFTLNNSFDRDASKTLEVKEGEKILLVTDENFLTANNGAAFGLLGVVVAAVIKANSPPEKELHNPLTIYKNEFMNKISMKKPVKVFVVEDK